MSGVTSSMRTLFAGVAAAAIISSGGRAAAQQSPIPSEARRGAAANHAPHVATIEQTYRSLTAHLLLDDDYDEAIGVLKTLVENYRASHDEEGAAFAQYQLGSAYALEAKGAASSAKTKEDYGRATAIASQAAEILAQVKSPDRQIEIEAHLAAAELHRRFLDDATAGQLFLEAASYFQVAGDPARAGKLSSNAGEAFSKAAESSDNPAANRASAIAAYEQGFFLRRLVNASDTDSDFAETASILAGLYRDAKNKEQAVRWYNAARHAYGLQNNYGEEASVVFDLLGVYRTLGTEQEAKSQVASLITDLDQIGEHAPPKTRALIFYQRGSVDVANAPSPATWFQKAKDAIDSVNSAEMKPGIRLLIARQYKKSGHEMDAFDNTLEALSLHLAGGGLDKDDVPTLMREVRMFYRSNKDAIFKYYDSNAEQERKAGRHAAAARLLARAALAMTITGDVALSEDYFKRAVDEDLFDQGTLAFVVSDYERHFNRYESAAKFVEAAASSFEKGGAKAKHAEALVHLADIYNQQYREPEAAATLERAAGLFEQAHDPAGQGDALYKAVLRYADTADKQAAIEAFQRARKVRQGANDKDGEAKLLGTMASLFDRWGEKAEANKYRAEAASLQSAEK
jgi:hypothetical protein